MSTMIENLAQTRHAERYGVARGVTSGDGSRGELHGAHAQSDLQSAHAQTAHTTTRSRAGWLLVGLGLRLALPGGRHAAPRRITLIGR